jgi:hypothetical protein
MEWGWWNAGERREDEVLGGKNRASVVEAISRAMQLQIAAEVIKDPNPVTIQIDRREFAQFSTACPRALQQSRLAWPSIAEGDSPPQPCCPD